MKKAKMYVTGVPYHSALAIAVLQQSRILEIVSDIAKADIVYHIFGPDLKEKNLGYWLGSKRHIVHWIGSDTEFYGPSAGWYNWAVRAVKKAILSANHFFGNLIFIASAPWIGDIVQRKSNIPVDYVLISTISESRIPRVVLERDIDFLTYIPFKREHTYSLFDILDAANNNLQNTFCIVIPNVSNLSEIDWDMEKYKNVNFLPNQPYPDMIRLICRSKCFLRLKDSGDAYALTVLEALFCGCNVLWNVPQSGLKGICFIHDSKELVPYLATGGKEMLLSTIETDEVAGHVLKSFSEKEWIEGIEVAVTKLVKASRN